MFKFETLKVWQKSINYTNKILDIVDSLPPKYIYTIGSQLTNAGVSIPNNIAEGTGRRSLKESNNFYNIAKGSAYETVNLLIILNNRNLLQRTILQERILEAEEISKMLSGLMRKK